MTRHDDSMTGAPMSVPPMDASEVQARNIRSLIAWALLCIVAGVVFLVYVAASVAVGGGQPVMPLDDAYIHFQYARVIASGYPYQYNPGLPATSGATSFLYPYLLAAGYVFGFSGLNLGLWAMGIGAVALALSAWIIYRFALLFGAQWWLALFVAVGFELNGAMAWHYMSGMETGLAVLFTLYTLYALMRERYWGTIGGATLLALIRPEGAILALLAVAATVWRERKRLLQLVPRRRAKASIAPNETNISVPPATNQRYLRPGWAWLCLLIPIVAIGLQPLINLILTGSPVASGNAAKSLFGIIPPDMSLILRRISDTFVRLWGEFFSTTTFPIVVGGGLMVLAGLGLAVLERRRASRVAALVIIATLLLGTLAISTLDTAFWHFKRYQMPVIALLFVLAIAGATLIRWSSPILRLLAGGLLLLMVVSYVVLFPSFVGFYILNAGYVAAQPLQMARWIRDNTPTDVVVAVHDTGSLRYMGDRTTLDIVGLTTPGAAEAWRNGPGSVAEFLERERPNYIASYGNGHGYGLGYLEDTGLYAETLATYTVEPDPQFNVALAAATQGIYRPQWQAADRAYDPMMLQVVTPYLEGMEVYDEIDVADVYSEHVHDYRWQNDEPLINFPTEVFQFPYIGCDSGDNCVVMDGGRIINGDERFTLNARPGQDMVLVTRLHPANAGTYDVFANDVLMDDRVVPPLAGGWIDVATLIPGELVTERTRIHIVPRTPGNFYMPYQHWAYQGNPYSPVQPTGEPVATFQDGAIGLYNYGTSTYTLEDGTRWLEPEWFWATDGRASGDYALFVHVINERGEIALQRDIRPGRGTLPPGNWLPGSFRESIPLNVTDLPPGMYQIAIGLFNSGSNTRLTPTGGDEIDRLFVDTIEIE